MAANPARALGRLEVTATPASALFDAPIRIRAQTPTANEQVTLEATTTIDGTPSRSWASYRTNAQGRLDLATSAPVSGTYSGTDPMGLFWSMSPMQKPAFAPSSLEPIHVRLTLYDAHRFARISLTRRRIAASVMRIPLALPLVGTLFLHRSGASGVVVVLGGSEGGMDENRAAIIASHGFDALSLAYFGSASLPAELANIPLEYIDSAIAWIHRRADLANLPILLEGDSKGAELALLAAARNSAVKGVIAFAPSSDVFEGFSTKQGAQRAAWSLNGVPLAFSNNPIPAAVKAAIRAERAAKRPVSFRNQYLALATPPDPTSVIPVENFRGPLLLIAGADDQLWPSDVFAQRIVATRRAKHLGFGDELLIYPDAGHQIDVPYLPTEGLNAFDEGSFTLALGGTAAGYARADAAMWPKTIAFMHRACRYSAPNSVGRGERSKR